MISRLRTARPVRRLARRYGPFQLLTPLRILELPLREVVRQIVCRMRRDSNLAVFGCPLDRFADNAAYLFLAISESAAASPTCVWISRSPEVVRRLREEGHRAELRWSWRGLRTCARAGWFVVSGYPSDINRWLHDGATYVNLWHGVGLKPIERDFTWGPMAFLHRSRRSGSVVARALRDDSRSPDWMLSSTRAASERIFSPAFGVPTERCLEYGYPRNDHLRSANDQPRSRLLLADDSIWHRLRAAPFVVGYFPTWREDDAPFIQRSGLSLQRLAEVVSGLGGLLAFKPHFNTTLRIEADSSALQLDPDDDLNVYLPVCDVLVTDYSSVASDFLLLRKPIIYFVPDLDQVVAAQHAHARAPSQPPRFTIDEVMPGTFVRRPEELYSLLESRQWDMAPDRVEAALRLLWGEQREPAATALHRFLRDGGRPTAE